MKPYTLHHGDCLAVLRTLPDASVDAVVTDPPYGLSFMGKRWDYDVPAVEVWAECLRVLKPGGHLLAFAGTRTQHRMAVRIEDAGFDIRDLIAWVYGSGFPKSRDVTEPMKKWLVGDRISSEIYDVTAFLRAARDKAGWSNKRIDALFGTNGMSGHWTSSGAQPAVPSVRQWAILKQELGFGDEMDAMVEKLASTERPEDWGEGSERGGRFLDTVKKELGKTQGWGTALKPALEPITVARKPLDGTVAQNVLAHGTGALNVDGCRVEASSEDVAIQQARTGGEMGGDIENDVYEGGWKRQPAGNPLGRWPANLIHDGSEEVVGLFPCEDSGSAARFFYRAKAAGDDRDAGALGLFWRAASTPSGWEQIAEAVYWTLWNENEAARKAKQRSPHVISRGNLHPTVKPTDLMRYLCRLVAPPNGVVLDPFTGSGSTGRGAILEGFRFIGIEREADYLTIARARIDEAVAIRAMDTAQLTML